LTVVLLGGTIVRVQMSSGDHFVDNVRRLAGLHGLTMKQVAMAIDATESTLNKWASGDRSPSFDSALRVGDLFGIDPGRLARAPFEDLLQHELADGERYRRAEETLEQLKREWAGDAPNKVISMKSKTPKSKRR
jgi:transcriptional regulator with XRE-family HTH domain